MRSTAGFDCTSFRYGSEEVPLYTIGAGPPVLILHELPGLTEAAINLGRRVAQAKFRVLMPEFLPLRPGKVKSIGNLVRVCIRREFAVWAKNGTGPFMDLVKAICKQEAGDGGIGVVGMCLTGGFALAAAADKFANVKVPIVCEASLPFLGIGSRGRAFQMSREEIESARANMAEGIACRFSKDLISPGKRLKAIGDAFGGKVKCHTVDSSLGNKDGYCLFSHSVLTEDYKDAPGTETRAIYDEMIGLFDAHLR